MITRRKTKLLSLQYQSPIRESPAAEVLQGAIEPIRVQNRWTCLSCTMATWLGTTSENQAGNHQLTPPTIHKHAKRCRDPKIRGYHHDPFSHHFIPMISSILFSILVFYFILSLSFFFIADQILIKFHIIFTYYVTFQHNNGSTSTEVKAKFEELCQFCCHLRIHVCNLD